MPSVYNAIPVKDITVHLHVEAYLKQWLEHSLGDPVRFPSRSYESCLLSRLVSTPPKAGLSADGGDAGGVRIVLPDNALRPPEYYHYLSRRSSDTMRAAIDALFRLALWSECAHLLGQKGNINKGIDRWCAGHGISIDYREGVRQKFYRMRLQYGKRGIMLGKMYEKKNGKTPS